MATFSDFRRLALAGDLKRFTYACGEEEVLLEEVVDATRLGLDVKEENYVSITLGEVSEKDVWATLNQYPLDPFDMRLVIVRQADRIRDWVRLEDWILSRHMPNTYALLLGEGDDFPYRVEFKDNKRVKVYVNEQTRDRITRSGRLVLCNLPKDVERREAAAQEIISGWGEISLRTALYLYRRTAGSLVESRDAMHKAALFSGEVTERVVDFLTKRTAAQDYVHAVLGRQNALAATTAQAVPDEEYGKVLAKLESDVLLAARINRAQKRQQTTQQLVSTLGEHRVRIDGLRPYAKFYDAEKMSTCIMALSLADRLVRSGLREGVLEMVAATW